MSVKYHVNSETGKVGTCKSDPNNPNSRGCDFAENGVEPPHFTDKTEAHAYKELLLKDKHGSVSTMTKNINEKTIVKNGVEVVEGKIAVGDFARDFNTRIGDNSYFDGSWEELNALVEKYWDDNEPGIGSVDGDVLLINLPPERFHTSVAMITDENRDDIVTVSKVRREGEKPVESRHIVGEKPAANFVQVVVYRADVLAQDDGRTTNAEWEIIAVLANLDKETPMHPETMKRNNNHDEGGTYREYSDKEWADAYDYWDKHVFVRTEE